MIYITKGITKEEFDILKPRCQCPCHELIPWKKWYKQHGVPKYINGHKPNMTDSEKKENRKNTTAKYRQTHKEQINKCQRIYLEKNEKKVKSYYQENKKQISEKQCKYYQKHKEHYNNKNKKYRQEHREQIKKMKKEYSITPNGKINKAKSEDFRKRNLGSEMLNDWFEGCNRHHINTKQIICIPKELHELYRHNHKKQETMVKINRVAFQYLIDTIKQI